MQAPATREEIKREIARLEAEAATARQGLAVLRDRLSDARAMMEDVRRALGNGTDGATSAEGTPAADVAQEEAKAG